jgi:hypothetical protein
VTDVTHVTREMARAARVAAHDAFLELTGQRVQVGVAPTGRGWGLVVTLVGAVPLGIRLPQEIAGVPVRIEQGARAVRL